MVLSERFPQCQLVDDGFGYCLYLFFEVLDDEVLLVAFEEFVVPETVQDGEVGLVGFF